MKLLSKRRGVAAIATALGVTALTALPASAYTSEPFSHRCFTNTGSYSVVILGNWYNASNGSTTTLADAYIWADSIYSWVVVSSRWEDLTTGADMRGVTGFVGAHYKLPGGSNGWDPNAWYRAGDNTRWAVSGYRDTDHNVTFSCSVHP